MHRKVEETGATYVEGYAQFVELHSEGDTLGPKELTGEAPVTFSVTPGDYTVVSYTRAGRSERQKLPARRPRERSCTQIPGQSPTDLRRRPTGRPRPWHTEEAGAGNGGAMRQAAAKVLGALVGLAAGLALGAGLGALTAAAAAGELPTLAHLEGPGPGADVMTEVLVGTFVVVSLVDGGPEIHPLVVLVGAATLGAVLGVRMEHHTGS